MAANGINIIQLFTNVLPASPDIAPYAVGLAEDEEIKGYTVIGTSFYSNPMHLKMSIQAFQDTFVLRIRYSPVRFDTVIGQMPPLQSDKR